MIRGPSRSEAAEAEVSPLHDSSWLYSYADLITQLLLFSILMFTVAGVGNVVDPAAEEKPEAAASSQEEELAGTGEEIERYVQEAGLSGMVAVDRGGDRLIVRIKSVLLFGEGEATLTANAETALDAVARTLARIPNAIRVEGHTDDVPIRSPRFPSNWELSTSRAVSVVRHLEGRGIPEARLSVAGYGEHRPIVENKRAEERALNRRVEIVVLGGDG